MKPKKSQIEILNLFRKNIFLSKTIREISLILKKPYPKVHETIKELENQNILKLKKIGNSNICELFLSQESTSFLSFLDQQESLSKKIPNIRRILEFKEFLDDIILITGSYAKNKQTEKSDTDILIITKADVFKKQKLLENLTLIFKPVIHPIVVTYKNFIDMLLSKEENLGKEAFKNHLIFRNNERYYLLIKEAIEHGFRI